ncbi:MAG: glutamate synthase central domain-containing protein, partial [Actinomycetota bacterium]
TKVGLIVETGDAREVHHMALLIGYGAGAINPYLAFESIEDMIGSQPNSEGAMHGLDAIDAGKAIKNYIKASGKGVLKVMSKMGVSTVASYTGAQIFEAIGLSRELVDEFFTGTVSRLGGISLEEVAAEVAARHQTAYPSRPDQRRHRQLDLGGEYQWRREGEHHLFNPETVFRLQHATRSGRYD